MATLSEGLLGAQIHALAAADAGGVVDRERGDPALWPQLQVREFKGVRGARLHAHTARGTPSRLQREPVGGLLRKSG